HSSTPCPRRARADPPQPAGHLSRRRTLPASSRSAALRRTDRRSRPRARPQSTSTGQRRFGTHPDTQASAAGHCVNSSLALAYGRLAYGPKGSSQRYGARVTIDGDAASRARGRRIVVGLSIVVLAAKLVVAATTFGTNDIRHWTDF